jgi:hypothetical protein
MRVAQLRVYLFIHSANISSAYCMAITVSRARNIVHKEAGLYYRRQTCNKHKEIIKIMRRR